MVCLVLVHATILGTETHFLPTSSHNLMRLCVTSFSIEQYRPSLFVCLLSYIGLVSDPQSHAECHKMPMSCAGL